MNWSDFLLGCLFGLAASGWLFVTVHLAYEVYLWGVASSGRG